MSKSSEDLKLIANSYTEMLHTYLQRHVVDFYISDFQSGLRALVKTGYGARVTPYVEEPAVIEVDQSNVDSSPQFVRWLNDRNIPMDDRVMRLKEGYPLQPLFTRSICHSFWKYLFDQTYLDISKKAAL